MARLATGLKGLLVLGVALHIHRHGPAIDYVGLAAACAASFAGVPGPGEPVLIAAAVFAAKHKLDLGSVVVVAFGGALAGGIGGWLVGLKAGRTVMTTRGPLHRQRMNALARGDALFARYTFLGVLLTPSWMAGIHNVRPLTYNALNAAIAAVWAIGIGVSAYFVGPPVVEAVSDLGTVTSIILIVVVVIGGGGAFVRWRRRRGSGPRRPAPTEP